jgi:hypothetical protein
VGVGEGGGGGDGRVREMGWRQTVGKGSAGLGFEGGGGGKERRCKSNEQESIVIGGR